MAGSSSCTTRSSVARRRRPAPRSSSNHAARRAATAARVASVALGRCRSACHGWPPTRTLAVDRSPPERKSTRLNSSHLVISYAVFCLKKKKTPRYSLRLRALTPHQPRLQLTPTVHREYLPPLAPLSRAVSRDSSDLLIPSAAHPPCCE